jgi:MutS domain I
MYVFIPRSLLALKRIAAKQEHSRFGATHGIRIAHVKGVLRAEATDGHRAMVVRLNTDEEQPPWPAFTETPDDAYEAVVLPKDLEKAAKLGERFVVDRFPQIGVATVGKSVFLGLGSDMVRADHVDGRFPNIDNVVPKIKPLLSIRVDAKLLAETLLSIADLLSDEQRGVRLFFYGTNQPMGICARNPDTGAFIDALVVPLVENNPVRDAPKPVNPPPAPGANGKPKDVKEATDAKESTEGKDKAAATGPTMQQYREAKERHPGMVLLFRVGEFYELFDRDAKLASKALGLTLTSRNKAAMTRFPQPQLETYLQKLVSAGHRVAVCDQVEAKGGAK